MKRQIWSWLCLVLAVGSYEFINWLPRETPISLTTAFDSATPTISLFVIPYLSFIPLIFLFVPLYLRHRGGLMLRYGVAVLATQMILNVLYFVVPATVERPTLSGTDVFTVLLRDLVWGHDRQVNTFPSNHVALTVVALMVLWPTIHAAKRYLAGVWGLLIIASTLLVKQHVVADVAGGIAVAVLVTLLVTRLGVGSSHSGDK